MKHFNISEFDSPDVIGSGEIMNKDFLNMLDKARELADTPFKITSGVRSEAHNKKVGGVSNSSHILGYAADVACNDSVSRFKILSALIKAGFNRIGIADTFIHIDNDPGKSENVIWTY